MSSLEYTVTCQRCGRTRTAVRSDARFCSGACRAGAARDRERETVSALAETIRLLQAQAARSQPVAPSSSS